VEASVTARTNCGIAGRLGQEAAESAEGASKSGFVAGAIRELSVGMCRGNFYVYRDGYGLLAGALGHGFRPGVARSTDIAYLPEFVGTGRNQPVPVPNALRSIVFCWFSFVK
jgi:hypothetical protein